MLYTDNFLNSKIEKGESSHIWANMVPCGNLLHVNCLSKYSFSCPLLFHQCFILIYHHQLVQEADLKPQYQGTRSHLIPAT